MPSFWNARLPISIEAFGDAAGRPAYLRGILGGGVSLCLLLCLCGLACSSPGPSARFIYFNRLDSMDTILTRTGVTLETGRGNRGLRIDAEGPRTIRLVEVRPDAAEGVELIYRGHLRSSALRGRAYFEIRCSLPGSGERLARGLKQAVTGTTDWVRQATPLVLGPEERCELVKLNVIVEGAGVVWVENIALARVTR